jgi:hypothetical protein
MRTRRYTIPHGFENVWIATAGQTLLSRLRNDVTRVQSIARNRERVSALRDEVIHKRRLHRREV